MVEFVEDQGGQPQHEQQVHDPEGAPELQLRDEDVVEAVRFGDGEIPFASTLWRTLSSAFSVATGAAIGREGSMIQFAAAAASWVGRRSGVRRASLGRQVSYGAAAAIAAAYSAPIAGMFFAFVFGLAP